MNQNQVQWGSPQHDMSAPAGENLAAPEGRPDNRRSFFSVEIPRCCNGIIEAAWLAAVVLAPSLCNPHSASGYQPNKIAFIRVLAFIAAAAWITKSAGGERPGKAAAGDVLRFCFRFPFVLALGALTLACGISTLVSVNFHASLWGACETAQGAITFGCVLVLFAALAVHLRRPEQVGRLITTIIIVSFPLALFGLIERAGYDPLPRDDLTRVMSLLGHPMYFASYLLLVMPLSLWRILGLAREGGSGSGPRGLRVAGLVLYGCVFAAQLLAFVFTESRGALLGLIGGLGFFAVSLGVLSRRRFLLMLGSGSALAIVGVLILLNLPNGPFQRWTNLPILQRFSQTFSQSEGAAAYRLDYWAAAVKLMTAGEPLPLGPEARDPWPALRAWVGYGPETVDCVISREHSSPGANNNPEFRLHDLVLDTWLNLGAMGVAALLAGFALVFFQVYRGLRWVSSLPGILLFFGLVFGMTAATSTALVLWRGPGLVGVGLQFGLAAGLALYPIAAFWLGINGRAPANPASPTDTLLLALLAALLAHLVDTAFGFETAATLVLFWAYPGMILALSRQNISSVSDRQPPWAATSGLSLTVAPGDPKPSDHSRERWKILNRRSARISAVTTGLILVCLLFAFIQITSRQPLSTLEVLGQSLTQLDHGQRSNPCLLPLLLLTWLGCSLAFTLDQARNDPRHPWRGHFLTTLVLSGLIAGTYAALKGFQIAALGPLPDAFASVTSVLHQGSEYLWICLVFLGICVAFVLWSGCLISPETPPSRRNSGPILATGIVSVLLAALLTWCITIRFLRADVACRWAEQLGDAGALPQTAEVLRRTLTVDPWPLAYRTDLAQVATYLAKTAPGRPEFEAWMTAAEQGLLAAPGGLDRRAYQLGLLYMDWAFGETDPATKLDLANKAGRAFDQALVYEPKQEMVWRESAAADILLLNRPAEGEAKIRRAGELVRNQNQWVFADYYAGKCDAAMSVLLKRQYGLYALEYYDKAINDAKASGNSTLRFTTARARLKLELGAYDSP